MSTAVSATSVANSLRSPQQAAVAQGQAKGWLFNPVIDGLVVANLAWPIIAIITALLSDNPYGERLGFLIAYFLIMPHRWITLSLVFLDPVKFEQNSRKFLFVAAAIVVGVCLTQLSFGALAFLLAIDLIWNAWHFAAQHAGIARIYDRMADPQRKSTGMADKLVLRTLILFAIFRMAATALPTVGEGSAWLAWMPVIMEPLGALDWLIIALPVCLILQEMFRFSAATWGRVVYLTSVTTLYSLMILGVHWNIVGLSIGCAAAATFFHSVEYLSIVTWYVKKNKSLHETKPFCYFIPRWAVALVTFMAACFLSAYMFKHRFVYSWVLLNVVISYLHYAYDGIIWKRPKRIPASA